MKLVVLELKASGISQAIVPDRTHILKYVRPHLYRHNFATGTVKMQLLDNSDSLLAESATVNIADLVGSNSYNYFHGYVRFEINYGLIKDTTYKLKLVGGDGYTFNDAAYVGWCNGFALGKYAPTYVTVDSTYPLDLEIWERKTK